MRSPAPAPGVAARSERRLRTLGWVALGGLFVVVAAAALVYSRLHWPRPALLAGEATYLMQAESLAHDFDLAYSREDFDRAQLERHGEPPDLELASGSRGRRITYDRPFPYALWLAPFLRLWPETGFVVANVVLLILAGLFAAVALEPSVGASAPLLIAIFLFGSVTWSYTWLATGDLFLLAVVLVAFGLVAMIHAEAGRLAGPVRRIRNPARASFLSGILLAIPLLTEPLYGVLAVAVLFALPGASPRGLRSAFLLGFVLSVLVQVGAQWWWSGGLHFLGTTRFRFTPATGFPLVDFTAVDWQGSVRRFQALYWDGAPRFSWGVDPLLWLWNVLYLFLGRHIGLLPYFLPIVLLGLGGTFTGYRRPIWIAAVAWCVLLIVFHPFNLYGGEGAIANRLFLPVYGALLFVFGRRLPWGWAVLALLVSSPFLWRVWTSPWSYPPSPSGGYRHVSPVAERLLPFETSQRPLPSSQQANLMGLRLRLMNEGVWAETRHERLKLDAERRARMVVASPVRIETLDLEFGKAASSKMTVRGARIEDQVLLANGGLSFRLRPRGWTARRHAVWWRPERQWLYCLEIEMPPAEDGGSLSFEMWSESVLEAGGGE